MAQRFDPGRNETRGDGVTIAETPNTSTFLGSPTASVSNTGAVAYRREALGNTELGWYSHRGELTSRIPVPPGLFAGPQVSPDGSQVSLISVDGSNADLWLIDIRRGTSTRLTSDPGEESGAKWSSDGARIIYNSDRRGEKAIYLKSLRGGGDELLYRSPKPWTAVWAWSRDGRYVVIREIDPTTGSDLWVLPTFGERKPFPYLTTRFEEDQAAIAPNGRWMAYISDESGRREVYVQTFPKPGDKQQISTDGGFRPIWSRDGRELLYTVPSGRMMSVSIRADTASIDVGVPRTLFTWPKEAFVRLRGADAAPDGSFVIALETSEGANRVPTLILNWPELMKKK